MNRKLFITFFLTFLFNNLFSQVDVCAFRITDYVVKGNDSIVVVQLRLGDAATVPLKQIAILKGNHSNGDTSEIGWGRCQLIKGDYYYFGIHLKNNNRLPKANDLLYTYYDYKVNWKGILYALMKHSIAVKTVTDERFISNYEISYLDKQKEDSIINLLVNDIHYTGQLMLKQNDNQDQRITGGRFDGKTLFATMQKIDKKDVEDFLKYIIVRPKNYAGNDWKISEIFATWATQNTPTVVE